LTDFFEKISYTKKQKNQDIITTKLDDKIISLRVIDNSSETLYLSTKWRQNNLKWFQSTFTPTEKNTDEWIKNTILKDPDRILFMIFLDGKKIGQTGLDRYVIEDNSIDITGTLKDQSVRDPRVMEYARKALLRWAFEYLCVSKVVFRVFSDNYRNISLIERCGALTTNSIPMKKKIGNNVWGWTEITLNSDDEIAERYLNIMEVTKENFNKN
jgi:RimJ/RimL family protein N-acetyltransferase